jgi:hypothetical protein
MAHLIIGHTTERTARIWVRGDFISSSCMVRVECAAAPPKEQRIRLRSRDDYTGVVEFSGLEAGTGYTVTATFSPRKAQAAGSFTTFPAAIAGPAGFSFILSSCNLSVVSVDNFLAFLLAMAGTSVGRTSLDLPTRRWKTPVLAPIAWLLKKALALVSLIITWGTGLKQPGTPSIRSPFLKLCAVFDSWILEVDASIEQLPAVGDVVSVAGFGGRTVASAVVAARGPGDQATRVAMAATGKPVPCRLVVTHVVGSFQRWHTLYAQARGRLGIRSSKTKTTLVGPIAGVWRSAAWYPRPAFVLHAGDQIYYDFPTLAREPHRRDYRTAYREAWFEDEAARHLLANYPNYMTLDDHEIANQYARDFHPPRPSHLWRHVYRDEALLAYQEYTHALAPQADAAGSASFAYQFEKGACGFFVLDTRTQRLDGADPDDAPSPRIIDEAQMGRLLAWLRQDQHRVKFVVTSVPFVAEVIENEVAAQQPSDWFSPPEEGQEGAPIARPNSEQDKWTAARFRIQRDQIIEHIHRHRIEGVVFLTGDMHCCYHASMSIGGDTPYSSVTIHELAGGPVNQLDLSRVDDFIVRRANRTGGGVPYDVVLDRFHGEASAVLYIQVKYQPREPALRAEQDLVPELHWHVIRTLTDANPLAWLPKELDGPDKKDRAKAATAPPEAAEEVMTGRIAFVRQRDLDGLRRWEGTRESELQR